MVIPFKQLRQTKSINTYQHAEMVNVAALDCSCAKLPAHWANVAALGTVLLQMPWFATAIAIRRLSTHRIGAEAFYYSLPFLAIPCHLQGQPVGKKDWKGAILCGKVWFYERSCLRKSYCGVGGATSPLKSDRKAPSCAQLALFWRTPECHEF